MGFLTFPDQLTEEEEFLKAKYQKLRKKKKALTAMKAPKSEPEPIQKVSKKRPLERKDAKEVAKKLLSSGKIAFRKPEEKTTFKRSLGLERKLSGADHRISRGPSTSLSPPYATPRPNQAPPLPSGNTGASDSQGQQPQQHHRPMARANRNRKKGNFDGTRRPGMSMPLDIDAAIDPSSRPILPPISPNARPRGGPPVPPSFPSPPPPIPGGPRQQQPPQPRRTGNTVYVFGYNITEDILRRAFTPFGAILSVSTEVEKNCGFVTFARSEMAESAIAEMNGSMFADVHLKVSLARRQPNLDPEALAAAHAASQGAGTSGAASAAISGKESWTAIAAAQAQKGPNLLPPAPQDKRRLIAYDDDVF